MADSNNLMGSTAAVAVTAAILSPRMRGLLRKGAVQGLAGVLIAGDAVSSFARGGIESGAAAPQPDDPESAQKAARAAPEAADAAQAAAEMARETAGKSRKSPKPRKSATRAKRSATPKESGS